MVTRLKFFILIFFVALLQFQIAVRPLFAEEPEPVLLIKVSFLLNFLKFTQWPANVFPMPGQPLILDVIGDTPMAAQIKKNLEGQLIRDKAMQVAIYTNIHLWQQAQQGRKPPHAVFISSDVSRSWREISAVLVAAPVLTMADFPGFCAQGGILNLVRDEDKIRFEANVDAAQKASLTLNAQMLQLAEIVATEKD